MTEPWHKRAAVELGGRILSSELNHTTVLLSDRPHVQVTYIHDPERRFTPKCHIARILILPKTGELKQASSEVIVDEEGNSYPDSRLDESTATIGSGISFKHFGEALEISPRVAELLKKHMPIEVVASNAPAKDRKKPN